jgi:hypothetical protein
MATCLCSCQAAAGGMQAALDHEFSLSIGQSAELRSEQIAVQFVQIEEDSRCPRGAMCIWQGRVRSSLRITDAGNSSTLVLIQPGLSSEYGKDTYGRYDITSRVEPYPELGSKIAKGDYRLFLTIRKAP